MSRIFAVVPAAGNLVAKVIADERSREQVEGVLSRGADRAACLVLEHRTALIALADGLEARDELTGDEVLRIVRESCSSDRFAQRSDGLSNAS